MTGRRVLAVVMLAPVLTVTTIGTVLTGGPAAAGSRTSVSVSITGPDPAGEVRSARRACKAAVTVRLVRQVGARGGGDDKTTGLTDTTGLQDGRWTYSFGNPGLPDGRYYATVRGTDRCKPASSSSIVVDRS